MPEKIAFLLDNSPRVWCSLDSCHLRLCRALQGRGVGSVMVYSDTSFSNEITRVFEDQGITTLALNYSQGKFNFYRGLGNVIKEHAITMAHVGFFNYFSAVPWLARLQGIHRIVFTEYTSGEWNPKWKAGFVRLRSRIATAPLTRLIAISVHVKRELMKVAIREDRIRTAYLGVDHHLYAPDSQGRQRLAKEFPITPDEIVLVMVSSFLPWKNVHVAVEACGILKQRGIQTRMFLCGKGPQREALEELAHKLSVADRIHFLGHRANVQEVLQSADVLVHCSVGEAFGWALIEGMGCGLPVVASRSGAIPEIVEDGKSGILATPMVSSEFAEGIEKLATDPGSRRAMGHAARKRVEENFTLDDFARNVIHVYEEIWASEARK